MRTVILGGGFGGLTVATELCRRLPEDHRITLVDRDDSFLMGFRKLWILAGMAGHDEGTRRLSALEGRGIRFVRSEVRGIDPVGRRVETEAGDLEADFLVVALGAVPRGDLVPGLEAHGWNLYDRRGAAGAAERVAALDSGDVAVVVAGMPYKCPPAPFEACMLLDERFRVGGVRDRVGLAVSTVLPALLPPVGPEGNAWLSEELERRGIGHRASRQLARLEPGRLVFEDGEVAADLALVVPPHRPPTVVAETDLAGEGGWIRVDRDTLATEHAGVYAVGDCVHIPLGGGAALPKAGVFAEAAGKVVAARIVAEVTGGPAPEPFDGRGVCFMETGGSEAALVEGEFFAEPGPQVRLRGASPEHARAKRAFEAERLEAWFGG